MGLSQKTSVFLISQINSKHFSFSHKKSKIFYVKKKNTQFCLLAKTTNGVLRQLHIQFLFYFKCSFFFLIPFLHKHGVLSFL